MNPPTSKPILYLTEEEATDLMVFLRGLLMMQGKSYSTKEALRLQKVIYAAVERGHTVEAA